jgi:hypothetical protein
MTTKQFSLGLIAGAVSLFIVTVAANIVLDPQQVFGTEFVRGHSGPNNRVKLLSRYRRDAPQIDGLIFGSSRALTFAPAQFAQVAGLMHPMSFAVEGGSLADYLPFLQYVLRDKAMRGERIARVLLVLDPDVFGTVPWTNRNLDSFLPPAVDGDSELRFWMRYLVAVQFTGWRESLQHSFGTAPGLSGMDAVTRRVREALRDAPSVNASETSRVVLAQAVSLTQNDAPNLPITRMDGHLDRFDIMRRSIKPFLEPSLVDLAKLVALCHDSAVELTVAINPLSDLGRRAFEPGHLEMVVNRINELTDIWDFESPDWLARDRSQYWLDGSHFTPQIADMMLRRMYANGTEVPADFGRFRPKSTPGTKAQTN